MNMEILILIKVLVIVAIIAARQQDKIRERRLLIKLVSEPKKQRMKKAMKFMKRTWRFWTPGKADVRVHSDLIKLLDERKLRYSVVSHNKNIEIGFDCENGHRYQVACSIESRSL